MIITGINESRTNQQHKRLYQQYRHESDVSNLANNVCCYSDSVAKLTVDFELTL